MRTSQQTGNDDTLVVLLHGILNTSWWVRHLERHLLGLGYQVRNISYPFKQMSIEDLGQKFVSAQLQDIASYKTVHFVGYSMGGLVIRAYLEKFQPKNLGRVVMLGTPNQGSEVADFLRRHPLLNKLFIKLCGEAGQQLATKAYSDSFAVHHHNLIGCELGVIAARRSILPTSLLIPGEDDGLVSVESTKMRGITGYIVVSYEHVFLPWHKTICEKTISFLESGKF